MDTPPQRVCVRREADRSDELPGEETQDKAEPRVRAVCSGVPALAALSAVRSRPSRHCVARVCVLSFAASSLVHILILILIHSLSLEYTHTSTHPYMQLCTKTRPHTITPLRLSARCASRTPARLLARCSAPAPSHTFCAHTQLALQALQTVVSRDVKPSDVEVCVVRTQQPKVTRLTDDEIEAHLTAIAERD